MTTHRLKKPVHITHHVQRAFSLVELSIATGLGLFVISGIITMYVYLIGLNTSYLQGVRLEQSLNVAMYTMTNDLRRAGYGGDEFKRITVNKGEGGAGGTECISFKYDKKANNEGSKGVLDDNEHFGYKRAGTALKTTIKANSDNDCIASAGTWYNLTDEKFIAVSKFEVGLYPPNQSNIYKITITAKIKGGDENSEREITEMVRIRNVYPAP